MKRFFFLLIVLIVLSGGMFFSQEFTNVPYQLPSFAYTGKMLSISFTDYYCSYFIREPLPLQIMITGGEVQELAKTEFSDGDRLYINKGSNDKIYEGQLFVVVFRGGTALNELNQKKIGTYHVSKGIAKVACVYEDKAVIQLDRVCHAVNIGDYLVPYVKMDELYQEKLDYRICRLPKSPSSGDVIYMGFYKDSTRFMSGSNEYVTVNIGSETAMQGDWVIFYKVYGPQLPPVIMGTGVVINPSRNNSTIKIIDATLPVRPGTKAVLVQRIDRAKKTAQVIEPETLPIIQALNDEPGTEKKGIQLDILFDFNDSAIKEEAKNEMAVIQQFIEAHPDYEVILSGFSCSIGGEEYNLALSQKRVESIKQYLMETFKIIEERINSSYYGEKDSPYDNSTEEQRRKNRLVSINVQIVAR